MDLKVYLAIFGSVFLAELGDKTQLATVCFAADGECKPWGVFLAASAALVLSTLIAVLVGSQLERLVPTRYLKMGAGAMFVVIGGWVLYNGVKS